MNPSPGALLTDLYQLTMLEGYYRQNMNETAVFDFFVRDLPPTRKFLVAAGLEGLLDYLENLRFSAEELDWLQQSGRFDPDYVRWLGDLRFRGAVHAVPEGTVVFQNSPLVRVTAPLPQAQLVESRLLNLIHLETLLASKAARCVLAAPNRLLVDFGMRRAHGAEAAMAAARASYIAGFAGTATVAAAARYHIPAYGTMAHSFVQAHEREEDAFRAFARAQPENVVLLIDTYDTLQATHTVVRVASELAPEGIAVKAVRIDSGDLALQSRQVRAELDRHGHPEIGIFVSGDLDEWRLAELVAADAPIDGYGVGTKLDTSADQPYLNCAYKLQEYDGRPTRKRSAGKASWPGRRQIFRRRNGDNRMAGDLVGLATEEHPSHALLELCMDHGRRLAPSPSLGDIRDHCRAQLEALPEEIRQLDGEAHYPVTVSESLRSLAEQSDARL